MLFIVIYYYISYEKSASLYALSHKSFEDIALKFIEIKEDEALKQFLVCKADTLSERDTTQLTVLLLWLLEIQLNQMSGLSHDSKEYQSIEAEFKNLISQKKFRVINENNSKNLIVFCFNFLFQFFVSIFCFNFFLN